jgi:hypothetical protein
VLIVPVRHHSPAAALQTARLIRERRPRAVLIEGPADATGLIDQILDAATSPPVALYAYRRDGDAVRAAYWPFCAYSPEYVALRVGREVGARVAFCDLPTVATLAWEAAGDAPDADPAPETEGPGGLGSVSTATDAEGEPDARAGVTHGDASYGDYAAALAEAAGHDTFEAFWEAHFEQEGGACAPDGFVELFGAFGDRARLLGRAAPRDRDARRERAMALAAHAVVAGGVAEADVLLVCGAAHAAAIRAAYARLAAGETFEEEEPEPAPNAAQIALIPYSYPRLSEQSGYGAGNRAPWFYQLVWELDGDYAAATRRALVVAARRLRERGHGASPAQAIDAYTLAMTLAALREKRAPGVDELIDAAVASFGQGHGDLVAEAMRGVLVGDKVGRISGSAGRTPLQQEFYATVERLRLPLADTQANVLVHLAGDPREAAQSVFFHRLAVLGVPYASEVASGLGGRLAKDALEGLGRARERWQVQWTPATDARLIERTAWGSTLAEACGRLLRERLDGAERVDAGTDVLLRLTLCDLAGSAQFGAALDRCEVLAADSGSFPALARATYHLDGLLAYGAARSLPADRLRDLAERLCARAVLQLPAAARCGDEGADEVRAMLLDLHELVQRGSPVVPAGAGAYWEAVSTVADRPATNPSLRGVALALLELGGRLGPNELAGRLRYWLSMAAEAADNARLVAGLFSLHRPTLVRNRAIVRAVTEFLLDLELEQLQPLLPALRRGLGGLKAFERSSLTESLADVLGLERRRTGRMLALASADLEALREADRAVEATLADWKERYGIGA